MSGPRPGTSESERPTRSSAEIARLVIESSVRDSSSSATSEEEEEEDSEESSSSATSEEEEEDDDDSDQSSVVVPVELSSSESETEATPPPPKRLARQPPVTGKGRGKRSRSTATSSTATVATTATATATATGSNGQTPASEAWHRVTEGSTQNAFRFHPRSEPGVNPGLGLDASSSAIDCFAKLFDDEVRTFLVTSINDSGRKRTRGIPQSQSARQKKWVDITPHELDKFLAVLISMGVDRRSVIHEYWSLSPEFYTPWYHSMFSRERFMAIYYTVLQAGDEDTEGQDKIEPLMNLLLTKFQNAFYPFRELSIDEMVIGRKGRWQFRQHNAAKPKKYHTKTFGLCDSATGYVLNILTFFGSNNCYDPDADHTSGQAVEVFDNLLAHLGSGHKIFADRFYTTRKLLDYLLDKHMHYTGILDVSRQGFAPQLKELSLQPQEMEYFMNDDESLLCVGFRDRKAKKPVWMVSSDACVGTTPVKGVNKPTMVTTYNHNTNGCDLMDQKVTHFCTFERKSLKWWKKVFFWLLEITQVNAFIIHALTQEEWARNLRLRKFKEQLLRQLTDRAVVTLPEVGPEMRRMPVAGPMEPLQDERHIVSYVARDRNCVYCSTPTDRKRTHFICLGCSGYPHLHPKDCFEKYHA